jgi:ectoine hydroxylase-related dioxygenase (phytanoyl-CoA dioxygenase family)
MQLTPDEAKAGRLTDENVQRALRTLRETGLVVIENVLDPAWLADFRRAYDERLEDHIAAQGGMDALNKKSFGKNHLGMHLPMIRPFSDPQVVANPIAVQVMAGALGEDLRCSFYHTNTAYPGSGVQPVHRDYGPLFGTELSVATPVTHVVVNIPLTDFTVENGSTEVWPGTHLIVDRNADDGGAENLLARAEGLPSIRTNIPAGSVVIRDLRLWHRGMPNNAQHSRTMLALVYSRGWKAVAKLLDIPRATWESWPKTAREIFRHNHIVETVDEVEVPIGVAGL